MICYNCRQTNDKNVSECGFCHSIDNDISIKFRGYYDYDGIRYITDDKKYNDYKKGGNLSEN